MSSLSCSFCQHANPADAKFCNACGSQLNLEPCAQCDAVNDLRATRCHACGAALGGKPAAAANDAAVRAEAIDADPWPASIVKALETVEADLATLDNGKRADAEPIVDPSFHPPAPQPKRSGPSRAHRLRPVLFAAFVACALAAVLLVPRLPLPPALVHATFATTSLVPAADAPDRTPAPPVQPPPPARPSGRTSSGPIEAVVPSAATAPASSVPIDAAQPAAAPAPRPAAQNDATIHDNKVAPGAAPRAACPDGVAALGLCNREDANDGR